MDKDLGDGATLRESATHEIARVQFIPEKGRNRIGSMVESRPDWVLSRQRAWGVPITLFVRPDGSYLQDSAVNARIVEAVIVFALFLAANTKIRVAEFQSVHDQFEFGLGRPHGFATLLGINACRIVGCSTKNFNRSNLLW